MSIFFIICQLHLADQDSSSSEEIETKNGTAMGMRILGVPIYCPTGVVVRGRCRPLRTTQNPTKNYTTVKQ